MRFARNCWMGGILVLVTAGCGYERYMEQYTDRLAEHEFAEKLSRALGPVLDSGNAGFRIRLPKGVKVAAGTVPEGMSAVLESAKGDPPFKLVVCVARPTDESPTAMSLKELALFVFDPGRLEGWMGPGVVPSDLTTEERRIPIGPPIGGEQRTLPVQWATIKQRIEPGGTGAPADFVWKVFFIDKGPMRAMAAFRVLADDYAGAMAQAIDISVTQLELVPATMKKRPGGDPAAPPPPRRGE